MRLEVRLVRSGDGETFVLGKVSSLEEASALVLSLDSQWAAHDFSVPPPEGTALAYYEGCDVYAREVEPPHRWFTQVDDDAWELDESEGKDPEEGWRDE